MNILLRAPLKEIPYPPDAESHMDNGRLQFANPKYQLSDYYEYEYPIEGNTAIQNTDIQFPFYSEGYYPQVDYVQSDVSSPIQLATEAFNIQHNQPDSIQTDFSNIETFVGEYPPFVEYDFDQYVSPEFPRRETHPIMGSDTLYSPEEFPLIRTPDFSLQDAVQDYQEVLPGYHSQDYGRTTIPDYQNFLDYQDMPTNNNHDYSTQYENVENCDCVPCQWFEECCFNNCIQECEPGTVIFF